MRNEYTKGFDDGVDWLMTEIERYTERREYEPRIHTPLTRLIEHLRMEKQDTRETT
jgi:hypothetical protein